MFMPESKPVRRTLADMILDKIREKESKQAGNQNQHGAHHNPDRVVRERINPKISAIYHEVGKFMSHYSSGKVPKAFKIVPSLRNWEEVLYLTNPQGWTCQAMFAATRLFASNLNPKMAQRFYYLILLPKIRTDIETHKKLNYHLYQAVKKALYKPAAFFKGLLLPLAEVCNYYT
jgi:essential nuclear protein 1